VHDQRSDAVMAAGVRGLATYVPPGRLSVDEWRRHWPGVGGPGGVRSVSVAGYDEDIVTMGVEAVDAVLASTDAAIDDIDFLVVATCSSPYAEHSVATEVARAVGLPRSAALVDLAGSALGGVAALAAATDAVNSGRARNALVVASERRRGSLGTAVEALGSGSVAMLVSNNGSVAIDGTASWRHGVPTRWRPDGDGGLHHYDDTRYEVNGQVVPAISAVLGQLEVEAPFFSAFGPLDAKAVTTVARAVGAKGELGSTEVATLGDLGSAAPLFALAGCLSPWPPAGERGVCAAVEPGSGALAVALTVHTSTPVVARRPEPVAVGYVEYLQRSGVLTGPTPPEPIVPYAATPGAARDDVDGGLAGARCEACGSMFVPPRRVCLDCGGDRFTIEQAPRSGTVVTFNVQHVVAVHPEPAPVAVGVVRLTGEGGQRGGQVSAMFCDSDLGSLSVGAAVEMVYRRIGVDDGLVKYGWKARVATFDDNGPGGVHP